MRQATVNLLAEMGANRKRFSRARGGDRFDRYHGPDNDYQFPCRGDDSAKWSPVTISGTAIDTGGGVVAGVEVSVDGGLTWHPAVGRSNWTYSWTPNQVGSVSILSRSVDDSANWRSSAVTTVTSQGPISIFGDEESWGAFHARLEIDRARHEIPIQFKWHDLIRQVLQIEQ